MIGVGIFVGVMMFGKFILRMIFVFVIMMMLMLFTKDVVVKSNVVVGSSSV